MIGFKTEFGLRKENGRIALTLASLSKGQPQVTRFILNPVVKDLLYSLARAGGLRSDSPTLDGAGFCRPTATGNQGNASQNLSILGQSQGWRAVKPPSYNPLPPRFRSSQGVSGSVFSGSV